MPPDADDFVDRAVAWMLDRMPPEYRSDTWLVGQPLVLALLCAEHVAADVTATREAFRGARVQLRDEVPPESVTHALTRLEKFGADFVRTQREADLVVEALRGRRWRARL